MGHVQDTPVATNMILNVCMISHMKVHIVSYNLSSKKFQNPKFMFCLFMNKLTPKWLYWPTEITKLFSPELHKCYFLYVHKQIR